VSTYGAGIPILHGTERLGGNVIWSTDRIEVSTTEEQGKGGGAEHTSYQYYVNMAIGLCETPRDGSTVRILKMFKDGKLVTDESAELTAAQAIASVLGTEAPSKDGASPTQPILYQGGPDQLPDPTMEAWEGGPGSVSAYRGIVYILLPGVECPGGRVPQYSFVLSTSAADVIEVSELADAPDGVTSYHGLYVNGAVWHSNYTDEDTDGNGELSVYYSQSGAMSLARVIPLLFCKHGARTTFTPVPCPGAIEPTSLRTRTDANDVDTYIDAINLATGVQRTIFSYTKGTLDYPYLSSQYATSGYDRSTDKYVMLGGNTAVQQTRPAVIHEGAVLVCDALTGSTPGPVGIYNDVVYAVTLDSGILYLEARSASSGLAMGSPIAGPQIEDGEFGQAAIYTSGAGIFVSIPSTTGTGSRFFKVGEAWELLYTADILQQYANASANFYSDGKISIVGPSFAEFKYEIVREAVETSEVRVADIIADLCERADEERYDVSELPDTDTVHGYKLQNPASARSNIEPLLTAFGIYVVDEDGQIKFKKYSGITSVATINYDELGQSEDGAEAADAMPLSRAQEIDLPRSVTCSYIEPSFDYQTASEKESRQVTEATEDLQIEIPIALSGSDHAKQIAQRTLFARWLSQNTRSTKVSRKYAFVSPGDGVTIEYPRGTWKLWRLMSATDTGALCEWNLEPGDAELMTQTAVGATGYQSQQIAPLPPQTRAQILDTSILRDADNNAGTYVAFDGFGPGFIGAELLIGDDSTNLQPRGTVSSAAPIGAAETALGDWTRNVVDEKNLVTVNVGDDELNSVTRAVLLNGTSNVAAIGAAGRWELIKFQRAESLGGGRYILSGLLRGINGTEHATASHEIGDTFVLMTTSGILRPSMDVGSIGQTKTYVAVSKGRSRSSGISQTYANTGEGLKPRSPVDLRKSITSNNITLTWGRRSRMVDNVLTTGVIPLGESVERYDVLIYSDGTFTTIKRVLSVFAASAVYSSAEQIADFGSNQTTLNVRVYQTNDTVGRGHELQATV
jgi:hypothetical protein